MVFLDGHAVLNQPLDGLFEDPAAIVHETLGNNTEIHDDEAHKPPAMFCRRT